MKRIILALLTSVCALCAVLGFSACKDGDQNGSSQNGWGNEYTISAAYAKAVDLGYDKTLEEFINTISGRDGTDGKDGVGIVSAEINDEGELVLTLSDGSVKKLGKVTGANGSDGANGVGIKDVTLDSDGNLTIVFTDDSTKELGKIPACAHAWSEWETQKEATCTSIGYKKRSCENCGYAEYEFTEEKGHVWDGGKELTGFTVISCTVCKVSRIEVNTPDDGGDHVPPDNPDPIEPPTSGDDELILPVENAVVSVGYVFVYDITLDRYHMHTGLDFDCEEGTSVYAVSDGTVTEIVSDNVLGNYITLSHEYGLSTTYKYVAAAEGLKVGDTVEKGDVIGTVEANGIEMKQGAHLHFEVMRNGELVDPDDYYDLSEK